MQTPLARRLEIEVADLRRALVEHPVHTAVDSPEALRIFMASHVFAVWDFMSLVKRLQREFTVVELPWTPPRHPRVARFINEIVLDEESDRGPDGTPCSHFELYVRAMEEVGADTRPVRAFLDALSVGRDVDEALGIARAPLAVRPFVQTSIDVALHGSPVEVAACFLFGREDVIPDMFAALKAGWPDAATCAPNFVHYLDRHIELDGGVHGDLARELLEALADEAGDAGRDAARAAARAAILARIALWDAVRAELPRPALR